MAGTYSNSIVVEKLPQYAYVLVILSGGIAFIVTQLGHPFVPWLFYALLGALFASVWPERGLHWGGWLCLPIILLVFFDLFMSWSINALFRNGAILVKAFPCACLGAYLGSKLSVRRIASLLTSKRVKRRRLKSRGNAARNSPVFKELATPKQLAAPLSSVVVGSLSGSANDSTRALLMGAPVQALNDALINAAQEGDLDGIKLLVANGADVNARGSYQWKSSVGAELGGDVQVVKTLFGEGAAATLDASDEQGWTALMIATIEGRVGVVRRLLEKGAQTSVENRNGWTALRFAVSMDETEILRVLLESGADANAKDREGKTALMQAAGENIRASLKMLLDAGADPFIKDGDGQTALMIAQRQGHTGVIKLLKEAEAKALSEINASLIIPDAELKPTAKTHRVIKRRRDPYYGLIDKYDVIAIGAALPSGCEEAGLEGNEEECLDYAWRNSIAEPSELGWWLGFSSQTNA